MDQICNLPDKWWVVERMSLVVLGMDLKKRTREVPIVLDQIKVMDRKV